jgi:hypothetical protein
MRRFRRLKDPTDQDEVHMATDELILCPRCSTLSPSNVRYCKECGASLIPLPSADRGANIVNASDGGTANVGDRQTRGSVRSNAVDASNQGTVAMGDGATAVGVGASYIKQQVNIRSQVFQTAGPCARFAVPNDTTLFASIFPRTSEELDCPLRIGDGATVEGMLVTTKTALVGDKVALKGAVFARDGLAIGQDCELAGPIYSAGPITVKSGTRIEATIVCTGQHRIELGENCRVGGILAGGDVVTGRGATIDWIRTSGDIITGPLTVADRVVGRSIALGEGSRVSHVGAGCDLTLGQNVVIDRCSVGGKLKCADTAEIRLMDSVVCFCTLPPNAFPFRLADRTMTVENAFVYEPDRGQLLPYADTKSPSPAAWVIISRHLTARLARKIQALAHPRFTLEPPAP